MRPFSIHLEPICPPKQTKNKNNALPGKIQCNLEEESIWLP